MIWALVAGLGVAAPHGQERLLRQIVAATAVAQARRVDVAWEPAQRDCAGLVRFAYRSAFARLLPHRVTQGLWRDDTGEAVSFADAATLLRNSFVSLGRDETRQNDLRSGDLLAYRQLAALDAEPVYHVMLVVSPGAPTPHGAWVVYHPGDAAAGVRWGPLRDLLERAPGAWRPVRQNPAFLGYFRLKEWNHDDN